MNWLLLGKRYVWAFWSKKPFLSSYSRWCAETVETASGHDRRCRHSRGTLVKNEQIHKLIKIKQLWANTNWSRNWSQTRYRQKRINCSNPLSLEGIMAVVTLFVRENEAFVSNGLSGFIHMRVFFFNFFIGLYPDVLDSCGPSTALEHDAAVLCAPLNTLSVREWRRWGMILKTYDAVPVPCHVCFLLALTNTTWISRHARHSFQPVFSWSFEKASEPPTQNHWA